METIVIRNALNSDKSKILNFCKNTFFWGDYIEYVWDYWITEGSLFVVENQNPIGMCHAFFSKNQVWIEGIRINSDFRRRGLASKLIQYIELISKEKHVSFSSMLIDTKNLPSLLMAKNLNYKKSQIWNFYSLLPQINNNHKIQFAKNLNHTKISHYVKSWRWLSLDKEILSSLCSKNKIIFSDNSGDISIAILSDSEHFDKTLIVTLFAGSQKNTLDLISYIQNYGAEQNYQKIQILTKEKLPFTSTLEHKITFNLMKKFLH
ncbi:MAG TPA: GNAT family N-acetyltransferase [Nitrosarchaeum sp.]|nr:GNAT family N-acetyltransferase [Nitrosarchaeum sp.]